MSLNNERTNSEQKIITEEQYNELKSKCKFWKWIEINCEKGYCSISKPIFNKTFDLAYIQISKKLFFFDYTSK
jgi:hypothetical protein